MPRPTRKATRPCRSGPTWTIRWHPISTSFAPSHSGVSRSSATASRSRPMSMCTTTSAIPSLRFRSRWTSRSMSPRCSSPCIAPLKHFPQRASPWRARQVSLRPRRGTVMPKREPSGSKVTRLASETLRSPTASATAKSLAGSALAQSGTPKRSSSKTATAASKALQDGRSNSATRTLAGSVLTQKPGR